MLLPSGKRTAVLLSAHLRSAPAAEPLPLVVLTIEHDGRAYQASLTRIELPAGQTDLPL